MIHCPKCNATLPDFVTGCQFCGTAFQNANVPQQAARRMSGDPYDPGKPRWVWPAYYGIAGWWVLSGGFSVLNGTVLSKEPSLIEALFGALSALLGLGLILRLEAIRGLINIACFVQILLGLRSLFVGFLFTAVPGMFGLMGVFIMLFAIVNIATSVLLIVLIGETDTKAPNF